MRYLNDVSQLIGNTPLIKINKLTKNTEITFLAKLEFFNPFFSIKDRIALNMLKNAQENGLINKSTIIIEPTSGNTGIGLAGICALNGYKLIIVMPENVSIERKKILKTMGAQIVLTPEKKGMKGAIEKAYQLHQKEKKSLILNQFRNQANPQAHLKTAQEIWTDTAGKVDILIAGVGTGGTITGIGKFLKQKKKEIKIVAVEPKNSPVLSGGKPGKHKIEGIGPGFIPEVLDRSLIDEIIQVKDEDAIKTSLNLCQKEGILAGFSSGAVCWAGLQIAKRKENKNKIIVGIFADSIERYLGEI